MTIKALIFDFDGLIIDSESPEFQVWQEVFAEHADLTRAGFECVVPGRRVCAIADDERVFPASGQRLHAGVVAAEASIKDFGVVLIDQSPFDVVHSFIAIQQVKVNFLPSRCAEQIHILRSRAFDAARSRARTA